MKKVIINFIYKTATQMKTFAAIAALAAVSSVNAIDAEFMRGAQTGMFLTSEDQFEDYSCPPAEISKQVQ